MLSFIPYLVLISLVCLVANLYFCGPNGVIRRQLVNMVESKNERSFNADETGISMGNILLLMQWFFFFGLILFTYINSEFYEDLSNLSLKTLEQLALCMAVPMIWFIVQWALYHWWTYLFQESGRTKILSRIYRALHMIAAPIAMLVFMFEMTGILSPDHSYILLIIIFIIAQIAFILSGIRIFWNGIGTLCFIIMYLCAFKIAPFLILWTKLG